MGIQTLFKKFAKELDEFWHTRMNPIDLRLRISDSVFGSPVLLLKDELCTTQVSEFLADHYKDSDDDKAFWCHYFIKHILKVKYKSDKEVWDKVEHWQTPQITALRKTGDCEDQTLLWMKLMQMLDVPSYKCMALGGYVYNNGVTVGHCWPVYFDGIRAVNMDLTYYVRVLKVKDRATFRIPQGSYVSMWWAFNWRSCYLKPYWLK